MPIVGRIVSMLSLSSFSSITSDISINCVASFALLTSFALLILGFAILSRQCGDEVTVVQGFAGDYGYRCMEFAVELNLLNCKKYKSW
jgi:hypothetical protein